MMFTFSAVVVSSDLLWLRAWNGDPAQIPWAHEEDRLVRVARELDVEVGCPIGARAIRVADKKLEIEVERIYAYKREYGPKGTHLCGGVYRNGSFVLE